jgi:membrane protease YdiL (CAAX protease family)
MLSAKPWKPDAVMRLLLSVFVCYVAGSLLLCLMRYAGAGSKSGYGAYILGMVALICFGATLAGLHRPWMLEDRLRRRSVSSMSYYVALMACFYAGVLFGAFGLKLAGPLGSAVPTTGQLVVTSLSFHGAALVFIWFFLREHRTDPPEAFGFSNNWPHALLFGLMLASAFLPIGWGLQWLLAQAMSHIPFLPFRPEEQLSVQTLRAAGSWSQRLVLGLVTIALAPVAEETLFRGILFPWIKQAGFPRLALWGTSLLFALMHLNAASFVPLFVLAVALALLYERVDNLLAPMAAHALFNGLNFLILFWVDNQPL